MPYAPRNVLKRVVELYDAKGWTPIVAPEMEFFLVARNIDPGQEIQPMTGRSGRPAAARQAYSISAVDEFGPVIDDIYDFAEAQGFEIDGITQEGGAGQLEINLRHGDPVKLADEVFYFKRLIREAALRHDCFATFMAKPIAGEPGSAMHIHHSVLSNDTGKNIFSDEDERRNRRVRAFHRRPATLLARRNILFAPYVNSFRRYVKDHAAPINLEWGRDNRTTAIRVPVSPPEARRIENRIAGMDCNPYLGIAASLACGYLGMIEGITPKDEFTGDAYDADEEMPARHLCRDRRIRQHRTSCAPCWAKNSAGSTSRKDRRIRRFPAGHRPWEREHLLFNV